MRHNKKFNHLGRTASHRSAMLANMAISLIMHKRITTTLAKAKASCRCGYPWWRAQHLQSVQHAGSVHGVALCVGMHIHIMYECGLCRAGAQADSELCIFA